MITGIQVYKCFNAVSLHFNESTNYDYFKYNGSVKVSEDSFKKNRFRWQFEHLAKELTAKSNFSPLLLMYRTFKNYEFGYVPLNNHTIRVMKSMLYHVESELNEVQSDFRHFVTEFDDLSILTECVDSLYPVIYNMYSEAQIGIESLILYDSYIQKFLMPSSSKDIIRWPTELKKFDKVRGFVETIIPRNLFNDSVLENLLV